MKKLSSLFEPMLFSRNISLVGLISITLLAINPVQVTAQEGVLEEIVVTAQFREEKLQDTPLAITAVSDDMMRARSQNSIFQVTQQAPNVQLKPAPGPFGSAMNAFIRGIGQDDFEFAREPGVGIYIDDVYFPTLTGSIFEILDLDRVEVLRGPQGTLQGRNSIGGAVRMITKKPTGEGNNYGEITYGDFNRIGGRVGYEFTILPDTLFARFAGVYNSKDGFQDRIDFACARPAEAAAMGIPSASGGNRDCSLGTLGGQNYAGGRATLRWTPNEQLEVNIIADLVNDDSESPAQTLLGVSGGVTGAFQSKTGQIYDSRFIAPNPYITYETFDNNDISPPLFLSPNATTGTSMTGPWSVPPVNHITTWGIAGVIDYQINDDLSFKSIISHRELDNEFSTATDGSPLPLETGWNHPYGESLQVEGRLNASLLDDRVDATVGVFWFEQDNVNTARIDLGYVGAPFAFDFITDQTYESESLGIYAHAVFHVNDRLNLTGGIRYSDEEKYQELYRKEPLTGGKTGSTILPFCNFFAPVENPPTAGDPPVAGANCVNQTTGFAGANTFTDDRFDFRGSIDYRWNDQFMTYFTYSTGFKSGGVSPRFFSLPEIIPYGVETLDSFDVGFKADLLDNRLRVNASGFYNVYEDQQLGTPRCPELNPASPNGPCLADRNLVDSDIWGFELEATFVPTDQWLFDASLSWIQMDFSRIDPVLTTPLVATGPTAGLPSSGFRTDADVPEQTPEWKLNFGAQYELSLGELGSLTPRLDFSYEDDKKGFYRTGAVGANPRDALLLDSYLLVNARLTWRSADEDWEAAFALTNATDEVYYHNYFDISAFGAWASGNIAAPREWTLTVRRNF